MEIASRKEKDAVVVSVKGRLDAVSAADFDNRMERLILEGGKDFVVDFAGLDYISSAGLRSILAVAKKLRTKDGQVFLAALQENVAAVFDISGFGKMIPIFESTEEALEKFSLLSQMF